MYKCVLFDFDGTVYDTVEGITKCVRFAINRFGMDAELEDLRCFAGPPLVDMFMERMGMSESDAQLAVIAFRERYTTIGVFESRVFPGVRELLEKLREAGMLVGIATSKPQELAEQLLAKENMIQLFDAISGGTVDGGSSKSGVLARAMKTLNVQPNDTVLIGDTKYDVHGAHECGIDCVGVRYGYAAEGELEAAKADHICADIGELTEYLLN